MRVFKRVAAVAMVAGLFIGPVVGAASASASTQSPARPSQVWLTGGDTSVTTAPGIAAALLGHGIVPIATLPGTEGASIGSGGVAVKFTFPVTGGWLMGRQALAVTRRLAAGAAHSDFLRAKLVTARFYCEQVLPQAAGLLPAATARAGDLLALSPAQF